MEIKNSRMEDIDYIFQLYRIASDYMKPRFSVHWPEFDRAIVIEEINEQRQWQMTVDGKIACIWATTFSDPLIWEDKNKDAAVYIHRIATAPEFRGRNLVAGIVNWAKQYARENDKIFVRMDTVGENQKLIAHYTGNGFNLLPFSRIKNGEGLPAHYYTDAIVCLFELPLPQ